VCVCIMCVCVYIRCVFLHTSDTLDTIGMREFFSPRHRAHTGTGAHLTLYLIDNWGPYPGSKLVDE